MMPAPLERSAAVGGRPKFRDTENGGCAWQKSDRVGQRYPAIERGRSAENAVAADTCALARLMAKER
jgi:hypothetical protein